MLSSELIFGTHLFNTLYRFLQINNAKSHFNNRSVNSELNIVVKKR
jgi:hypothetical protein